MIHVLVATVALLPASTVPRPAATRGGVRMCSAETGGPRVSVADLGLIMDDLDVPLPELEAGSVQASGRESTSLIPGSTDLGCEWRETAQTVEADLSIPGLRGQPAMALAVELTENTATVTAFGRAVWSCIMRGEIVVAESSAAAEDGDAMLPVLKVVVRKTGGPRWGGFIRSVGEDSILQ